MAKTEGSVNRLPASSCLSENEHMQRDTRKKPLTLGTNASQTVHQGNEEKSQADFATLLKIRAPRLSQFSVLRKAARRTYFPERIPLQVKDTSTNESLSTSAQPLSCTESTEGWHEDLQLGIDMLAAIQIIGDQEQD